MTPEYSIPIDLYYFALIFALIWGGFWALFLQKSKRGQFWAAKRTWLTVVIGIGADFVIGLATARDHIEVIRFFGIVAFSSVFIIYRSLTNEQRETEELSEKVGKRVANKVQWNVQDSQSIIKRMDADLKDAFDRAANASDTLMLVHIGHLQTDLATIKNKLRDIKDNEYSK